VNEISFDFPAKVSGTSCYRWQIRILSSGEQSKNQPCLPLKFRQAYLCLITSVTKMTPAIFEPYLFFRTSLCILYF